MILQHEVEEASEFIDQMCNSGSIVGRIVRIENLMVSSHLNSMLH